MSNMVPGSSITTLHFLLALFFIPLTSVMSGYRVFIGFEVMVDHERASHWQRRGSDALRAPRADRLTLSLEFIIEGRLRKGLTLTLVLLREALQS